MKITAIEAVLLDNPYPVPFRAAWRPDVVETSREITLVQVSTDAGIVGIGASGNDQVARINDIAVPMLIGKDPFDTELHSGVIRHAHGAWIIDMALCDIIGKAAGLPLHQLWGTYQHRIKAYVSVVTAAPPEQRADDALRFLEQGFRAIKLRAHHETIAEDIRVVEVVRQAVGDRMEIMVDANQAGAASGPVSHPTDLVRWDFNRALATARAYQDLDVIWLEEPLPRYQFENLTRLCDAVDIKIAGGEGNSGLHEFYWMLRDNVYDILQPDATTSEGLSQLRKIAAAAELYDREFIPHHGANGIALAAHLQLCATLPNSPYVEHILDPPHRTVESYQQLHGIVTEPLLIDDDGYVPVPDAPGLGIQLNPDLITRYTIR